MFSFFLNTSLYTKLQQPCNGHTKHRPLIMYKCIDSAVVVYTTKLLETTNEQEYIVGACKHKIFGFVCPLRIYPTVRFASSWSVDKINGLYIVRSMENLETFVHPVDIAALIHTSTNPTIRLYTELWPTSTAFYEGLAKILSANNCSM